MSILSCRVLCLLAIVLCCVDVTHAAASQRSVGQVDGKTEFVEKTKKLKEECEKATKDAKEAAYAAQEFFDTTKVKLKIIAANPNEVEETKSKGHELSEKAMKAAKKAGEVAEQTTKRIPETKELVRIYLTGEQAEAANEAIKEAEKAALDAEQHAEKAVKLAYLVLELLQQLDAAVVAAKEKEEEKQVEPQTQPQEQTNETSRLPNNATITNGTKRNDGSSSPALLRVPLVLLLLLSVLGCMAVC
ncbi:uncharacterized protein TM35_000023760 [Trypanosoma theileri]|uniref:Surface protein TolT n=1 Tax=Trypanosoma theileri TaxID=67003 RepID=A0A1X0P9B7_9TRYP|nr:uncharacterized protein TM35_000023760 [Trypanosoma theileri]ORC93050.1 hypothetical protein TM35_000023760 [Trypanosoma theileri]